MYGSTRAWWQYLIHVHSFSSPSRNLLSGDPSPATAIQISLNALSLFVGGLPRGVHSSWRDLNHAWHRRIMLFRYKAEQTGGPHRQTHAVTAWQTQSDCWSGQKAGLRACLDRNARIITGFVYNFLLVFSPASFIIISVAYMCRFQSTNPLSYTF